MSEENSNSFFQNKNRMLSTSLVIILLSMFIIVWGAFGPIWAFWIGAILLFAGMFLAPLSRFTAGEKKGEENKGQQEE